jgi:hypothetical protein
MQFTFVFLIPKEIENDLKFKKKLSDNSTKENVRDKQW